MEGYVNRDYLIESARSFAELGTEGESKICDLLNKATKVSEVLKSIKSYADILENISGLTVNGNRRKLIVDDLRKENRRIIALEEEINELRESTDECFETINRVIGGHEKIREHLKRQYESATFDDVENVLCEINNKTSEKKLKDGAIFMKKLMSNADKIRIEEEKEIGLKLQKNKVYRELFNIACLSNESARETKSVLAKAKELIEREERADAHDSEEDEESPLDATMIIRN